MSTAAGSVSYWILQAGRGDELAFAQLHQRYWPRVVGLAERRLCLEPRLLNDAEDIAQRAFMDLFLGFRSGRVPELSTRHQLLALMSHIVVCRTLNEIRAASAARRGGPGTIRQSLDDLLSDDSLHEPLEEMILRDSYESHVQGLPESLRPFAEMHLAGFTNREIADQLCCVERTVERKVALLRDRWQQLAAANLQSDLGVC